MSLTVYLNGQFLPHERASVPVEDRAFLFADGIYEVIRVYGGHPFAMQEHMQRLRRSARELKLPEPDTDELTRASLELIRLNCLTEATIYIQISRGAYSPRTHQFPTTPYAPNVLVLARTFSPVSDLRARGVSAVTLPDQRWARCDIKSVSLLPNILAKQAAAEAGAYEAILIRDGFAVEGSSSNLFGIVDGEIRTYPLCNYILGGITRQVVIQLIRELGYTLREEGIRADQLALCTELWTTSTTSEVMPIVRVDGRQVGSGAPGPVTLALHQAFVQRTGAFV